MISKVYAMAPTPQGQSPVSPTQSLMSSLVPVLVIFGIFYFLIIRPQKKKDREHKSFLESLKKGDEVLTQSGIYGRIAAVTEGIVTLEVAQNVKIRVAKSTIVGLTPTDSSAQRVAS